MFTKVAKEILSPQRFSNAAEVGKNKYEPRYLLSNSTKDLGSNNKSAVKFQFIKQVCYVSKVGISSWKKIYSYKNWRNVR